MKSLIKDVLIVILGAVIGGGITVAILLGR